MRLLLIKLDDNPKFLSIEGSRRLNIESSRVDVVLDEVEYADDDGVYVDPVRVFHLLDLLPKVADVLIDGGNFNNDIDDANWFGIGGLSFNEGLLELLKLAPVALELAFVPDDLVEDDSWPILLLVEPVLLVLDDLLSYVSVRREFRDRLGLLGATIGIGERPRSVRDELNDVDELDVLVEGVDVKLILWNAPDVELVFA